MEVLDSKLRIFNYNYQSIMDGLAIETNELSYRFPGSQNYGIHDVSLKIPWGSTNLVIGSNGAGKSTLLKILAGKILIKQGQLKLGGFDPFEFTMDRNGKRNSDINNYITYLGIEWATNPIVKRDIPVNLLISSIGGDTYSDRRDRLIEILDIDAEWVMSKISDGERRRVQLVMGLIKPWKLLLLDEVTVDLDVVARTNLLKFLREEAIQRNVTVVYATHIFDGLKTEWCDNLIHLNKGSVTEQVHNSEIHFPPDLDKVQFNQEEILIPMSKSLHPLALQWLYRDLNERGTREEDRANMRQKVDWQNKRDGSYYDNDNKVKEYFKNTRSQLN